MLLRKAFEAFPALAALAFLRSLSSSFLKRGGGLQLLLGGLRSLSSSAPVLFSYPEGSDSGGSTTLLRQYLLRLRIFLLPLSVSPWASRFCRFDSAIRPPSTSDGMECRSDSSHSHNTYIYMCILGINFITFLLSQAGYQALVCSFQHGPLVH